MAVAISTPASAPISLAMAVSTGWRAPILTFGLFVAFELFCGNILEPWLYGKGTGVSPVAVVVAAIFWTWLWGYVGLLLATPLTVCLLVIGKHVPQLSFLDILLGNEQVFEPTRRVYQRLLAGDLEEAAELVEESLEHSSLVEVYDDLAALSGSVRSRFIEPSAPPSFTSDQNGRPLVKYPKRANPAS